VPLPPFTEEGLLPAGDYPLTLDELRASFLVTGVGVASTTWDAPWRARLVDGLAVLVGQLWQVGIDQNFPGLMSGICDSFGNEREFPSAFRLSRRAYRPKGIVQIVR
jgi:hypothetical protein